MADTMDYKSFRDAILRDFDNNLSGLEIELSKIISNKFGDVKLNPAQLRGAIKDALQVAVRDLKGDNVDKISLTEFIDSDPKKLEDKLKATSKEVSQYIGEIKDLIKKQSSQEIVEEYRQAGLKSAQEFLGAYRTAMARGQIDKFDLGIDKSELSKIEKGIVETGIITKQTVSNINSYLANIGVNVNSEKITDKIKLLSDQDIQKLFDAVNLQFDSSGMIKSFQGITNQAKITRDVIKDVSKAYEDGTPVAENFATANERIASSFQSIRGDGSASNAVNAYVDKLKEATDTINGLNNSENASAAKPSAPLEEMRQASTETADVVVNNNRREAESFGEVAKQVEETVSIIGNMKEMLRDVSLLSKSIHKDGKYYGRLDPQILEDMAARGEDTTKYRSVDDARKEFHQSLAKYTANENEGLNQLKQKAEEVGVSISKIAQMVRQVSTDASMRDLQYGTEEYNKAIEDTAASINKMYEQNKLNTIEGITEMQKLINLYKIYNAECNKQGGTEWRNTGLSERIQSFIRFGRGYDDTECQKGSILGAFANGVSSYMRSEDTGAFTALREVIADFIGYESQASGFNGSLGLKTDLETANKLKSVIAYIEEHLKDIQAFNQGGAQTSVDTEAQKLQQQVDILRKAFTSLDTHQTSSKSIFQWISENCTEAEKSLMGASVNLEEFQKVLRGIEFNSGHTFSFSDTLGLDVVNWNELTKAEQELEKFYDLIGDQPFRQWEKEGNPLSQIYHGLADDVRNGLKDAETAIKEFNAEKEKLTQTVAVDQNTANMEGQVTNQVQQHTEAQKQLNDEMREGQQIQQEAATKPAVEVNEYTALTKQLNEVLTLVASINTLIKRNRSTIGESANEQAKAFKGLYDALDQVNQKLAEIGAKKISINLSGFKDITGNKLHSVLEEFDKKLNDINNKKISINLSGLKDVENPQFVANIEKLGGELNKLPDKKININFSSIKNIDDLEGKLKAISTYLGSMGDKQIGVRLDGLNEISNQDISTKLNSLKEALQAFPENLKSIDLKGISNLNELLKMDVDPEVLADKFGILTKAIGDFATELQKIPALDNGFISSINNLIANGDKLANIATLIKAKQSDIDKVQNAVGTRSTDIAKLKSIEDVTAALAKERAEVDKLVDAFNASDRKAQLGMIDDIEKAQQSVVALEGKLSELKQKQAESVLPKSTDYSNALKYAERYWEIKLKGNKATQEEATELKVIEAEWDLLNSKIGEVTAKLEAQGRSTKALTDFTNMYANRMGSGLQDYIASYVKKGAGTDPLKYINDKILPFEGKGKYTENIISSAKELQAALSKINLSQVFNEKGVVGIDAIVAKFKELKDTAASMEGKLVKPIKVSGLMDEMSKYLKTYSGLSVATRQDIKALFDELNNSKGNVTIARFNEIANSFNTLRTRAREAGEETKSFWTRLGEQVNFANAKMVGMYLSFYRIIGYIRQMTGAVIELDSALTELRKITGESTERMEQSFKTSAVTAKELGSTIDAVISQTSDWSRFIELDPLYGNI